MDHCAGHVRRLLAAVNTIDGVYYLASKKLGLNENEAALLYALCDGGLHSQKQICEDWLIPRTTINTIVRQYKAHGYLTLRTLPGRGRESALCLTEAGAAFAREKLRVLTQAENAAMEQTLQGCSPAFIADLERFGQALKASLETGILSGKEPSTL
ncbi:MAG: helix-turn-helix domain-containing protein [Eubacteriales bacterium]|nr:helix-turn-helix domain-containing protein [Eubacteriales bacterium]